MANLKDIGGLSVEDKHTAIQLIKQVQPPFPRP